MAKQTKCNQESWCSGMADCLGQEFTKGLSVFAVTNLETLERRTIGVVYRKSSRDPGLMLNVCPWCTEPILWKKAKPERKAAA